MADKYAKLRAAFRAMLPAMPLPIFICEVVAVAGETCTVKLEGGLELDGVRLRPSPVGAAEKAISYPKEGSNVLVGSLTGSLEDLCVLAVDTAEKLEYSFGDLKVVIDGKTGKVKVANNSTSAMQLFADLVAIIRGLKVNTPAGPSAGILPDTEAALQKFETAFKTLFN